MLRAWTDYPLVALGDTAGQPAPVREVEVVSYDGDKYCRVRVCGRYEEIKIAYIYQRAGRLGDVPPLTPMQLAQLEGEMNGNWEWLIGRELSLGEVVDICNDVATVRHGDDETRVLLCELLYEEFKAHDRLSE